MIKDSPRHTVKEGRKREKKKKENIDVGQQIFFWFGVNDALEAFKTLTASIYFLYKYVQTKSSRVKNIQMIKKRRHTKLMPEILELNKLQNRKKGK